MSIDDIINSAISGVKEEWPLIYKIRYVYITLGKFLKKNTDFFFSVDHKLGEMNMSFQDIRDAYSNDDELSESIICKSSSIILKMIYDRLGIKSRLVKSLNNIIEYDDGTNKIDINHRFLAVSDGENEYFCTLSSDLPYIQMGMETKHFGVNIPYFKKIGDIEQQVYEGEEIKHTVISKELLRKIDIAIGYIKNQYRYDENYSPVFNRINLYSIKNKKSGEYSIVFHILDDETFADIYYFYDPKENEFKLADIIDIYSNFIIVSNRFKSNIEEMENIEVEEEKRLKFSTLTFYFNFNKE